MPAHDPFSSPGREPVFSCRGPHMTTYYGAGPYMSLSTRATHPEHTYTCRAAAMYLGFSDAWLSLLRQRGRGPRYIKVGARCWYSKADLDQWQEAHGSEHPSCRVLGVAQEPGKEIPWYKPSTRHCVDSSGTGELAYYTTTVYKVALPAEMATEQNGGYGYLVVETPNPYDHKGV